MNAVHLLNLKENESVIRQGEVSTSLYRIKKGIVAGIINVGTEDEFLVEVMKEGRFFGELGFFAGVKNGYSVVTQSDCLIERIDKDKLQLYLKTNPGIGIDIMKHMAKSNGALSKHLGQLSEELLSLLEEDKPVPVDLKRKLLEYKVLYR